FTGFHIQDDGHMHFEDDSTGTDVDLGSVSAGDTWLLLLGVMNDAGTKKIFYWAGVWDYDADTYTEVGGNLTGVETTEGAYTKQCQAFEPNNAAARGGIAGFSITKRRVVGVPSAYKEITNLMSNLRLNGLPKPQDVFPPDW
ncbi:MAG: hypothetical protein ACXQTI_05290, partial [Candidatus Nezhaarchaeales archaeon]